MKKTLKNAGRTQRGPRGYLLAESMVAGGIIAVVLSVSVAFVVEGRKNVTTAAARQAAMSLARGKCDEIAAALPTATANQSSTGVSDQFPGFRWSWVTNDVSASLSAASTPPIVVTSREILCTVNYPAAANSVDDTKTAPAGDGRAALTVRKLWFLPQGGS